MHVKRIGGTFVAEVDGICLQDDHDPGTAAGIRDALLANQLTAAIHVYGGDFFGAIPRRHSWDPETLERGPYDYEQVNALRDEANARMEKLMAEGARIS